MKRVTALLLGLLLLSLSLGAAAEGKGMGRMVRRGRSHEGNLPDNDEHL